MSFDQEPDPPVHGECAAEIAKLNKELEITRRVCRIVKRLTEDAGDPMITAFCKAVFESVLNDVAILDGNG